MIFFFTDFLKSPGVPNRDLFYLSLIVDGTDPSTETLGNSLTKYFKTPPLK